MNTIKKSRKHPNLARRYFTYMGFVGFTFIALIVASVYLQSQGITEPIKTLLTVALFWLFIGFMLGHIIIYRAKCPSCYQKLKVAVNKQDDTRQGYCARCKIQWDLGIGANTDP